MKNAKTNTNAIVFAQAQDSTKAVVANKYVAHALYTQNKALVEALGGEVIKGVDGFRAEFKTAKTAKAFIAQAITSISEKDYNKARKTTPKTAPKVAVPATAKGKKSAPAKAKGVKAVEYVTVYLADGTPLQVKASDLTPTKATAPKKATAKGNAKPTTAPNAKAKKAEPKKSKGNCKVDFSKLAGKGRTANKDAAALMRKAGLVDGTSAEYKAVWAEWCKVR